MKKDISDTLANDFFKLVQEKLNKEEQKKTAYKRVIEEKNNILIPIKKFLKRLVDAHIYVIDNRTFDPNSPQKTKPPQQFQVWEQESNPSWQPGNSLLFDHPAIIEIAVPNIHQREKQGLIIISCVSEHPDSSLLTGPFFSTEDACKALSQFLSKSTVRIDK